jgi:Flp pilus assembly protein CpaB
MAMAEARRASGRALIAAGLVLAVAVAGGVFWLTAHPETPMAPARTVSVVVATGAIPVKTQVAATMVEIHKFAPDEVPAAGALTDLRSALGQYASVNIPKGAMLLGSMLAPSVGAVPPPPRTFLEIPSGMVAVSIPAGGPLQNVNGHIQAGDHIDVISYGLPGERAASLRYTFHNLVVQEAGGQAPPAASGGTQSSAQPAASSSTWVVFLPPDEAQELLYTTQNGQYVYVLLSRKDWGNEPAVPTELQTQDYNAKYGVR